MIDMIKMHFQFARILILISAGLLLPTISSAHSPHHVISDVASAPVQASDSHTFILITDQIFRSAETGAHWKNLVNGLNNQYSLTSVELSPEYESDQTLFVASSGDGVYRSTNYGDSWQNVNEGLGSLDILKLSISDDFASDRRLLAAAKPGGVWRSIDGGDSWQMVLTENVKVTGFAEFAGLQDQAVVIAGDSAGNVWRSEDNGRLWEIIYELPNAGAITSLSGSTDHLYIGTEKEGLYQSSDGGSSFKQVLHTLSHAQAICQKNYPDQPVSDSFITSVTVTPGTEGENEVLATTWYGGVFVSKDDARSWSVWRDGLSCDSQADRTSAPHFRDLEVTKLNDGETIYWIGAFDGLFQSVGMESPWEQQETLPLGLIKGMAVSAGNAQPLAIALSTYGGGFYLTEDRGTEWTIGNRGLLTTRLTGLEFSPNYSEDNTIYAGAIRRLLISSDRGQSWQLINLQKPGYGRRVLDKLNSWGLPDSWTNSSGSTGSSPIYPTHIATLPGDRNGPILFATRNHGVMAFDKSTGSIESVWTGTDKIINSLSVSPDFTQDRTLFSSIRGEGVFRSDDGGATWIAVNRGLDFIGDWALNPDRGDFRRDVSLSISPNFSIDHTLFAGSPASDGLYVSDNRGNSWVRSTADFGVPPAPVLAVAVSPEFRSDDSLLISIKGRGLFRSLDRGRHFEPVGNRLVEENASIEYLEFSPDYLNDQSIVAASDEKLFLSVDRGNSWTEVKRPVRYEDMRDVVKFEGGWQQQRGNNFSALTETTTSENGSSVSLRFVGRGIRLLGSQGPEYGSAQVLIDGELRETISLESDGLRYMQELFELRGLDLGPHTIEIRALSAVNGLRPGVIAIDAFDVLP